MPTALLRLLGQLAGWRKTDFQMTQDLADLFQRPPSERSQVARFRRRGSVTMGKLARLTQHEVTWDGEVAPGCSIRDSLDPEVHTFYGCGGAHARAGDQHTVRSESTAACKCRKRRRALYHSVAGALRKCGQVQEVIHVLLSLLLLRFEGTELRTL